VRITTEQDAAHPNPTFIPAANHAAQWLADRVGGIPQSGIPEALFNVPGTAHILGGAVIAADPTHGVTDAHGQVFGYQNLLITDGSALPANPGVNPSLTITALAEHTLAHVPHAHTPEPRMAMKQTRPGKDLRGLLRVIQRFVLVAVGARQADDRRCSRLGIAGRAVLWDFSVV
jgi:choline dehydrogenase-like flavoprotein